MKQENGYKKGFWTEEDDKILTGYVRKHGEGRWHRVTKMTGLRRCGKSCRLRWINYLCPSVNRDDFSEEEDDLIIRLHNLLGNRWSLIAGRLPGRTDNLVKNHWNTRLRKKLGIKKEENKVRASSRAIPITVRENFNNSLQTNLGALLPNGNQEATNQKPVLENDTTRFVDSPKTTMNDESSFWFSDDDLSLKNPNLEQFLDQNSLDLATNQKAVLENDCVSVCTTRFLDSLKMTMNDESSFGFPDDDLSLNNPNFEQLLDQNSINFVWNGF